MTIYTQNEMTIKKYNSDMAATAASFILEERYGKKQRLDCSALSEYPKKVTLETVNEITSKILAKTKVYLS
jgi:hypothetical protein